MNDACDVKKLTAVLDFGHGDNGEIFYNKFQECVQQLMATSSSMPDARVRSNQVLAEVGKLEIKGFGYDVVQSTINKQDLTWEKAKKSP